MPKILQFLPTRSHAYNNIIQVCLLFTIRFLFKSYKFNVIYEMKSLRFGETIKIGNA